MLSVSQELKDKVTTLDFKKEVQLRVDNGVLNIIKPTDGLVSVKYNSSIYQNGSVLGSVVEQSMEVVVTGEKRVVFETEEPIYISGEFSVYLEENTKETLHPFPTMIVDKTTMVYDGLKRTLTFKAFDLTRNLKKEVLETDNFSGGIYDFIMHTHELLGGALIFADGGNSSDFLNNSYTIDVSRYYGKTYLDIFSDIAEVLGGSIVLRQDSVYDVYTYALVPIQNTNIPYPIHKNSYWDITTSSNLTKENGVNTVVLSLNKGVDGENVTVQNGNEITDGVISLNIYDNQIVWNNDLKLQHVNEISNKLFGYTYTPFEMQYIGYPFLEVGDKISFVSRKEVLNTTTQTYEIQEVQNFAYIQSLEYTYDGGSSSVIKAFPFENAVEKRMNTNPIKEAIKRTELYVDKELGIIQSVITDEVEGLSSQITQTADGIQIELSELKDQDNVFSQRISEIDVDLSSIRLEVSQMGGYNIISNPIGRFGTLDWTFESPHIKAYAVAPFNKAYTNAPYLKAQNDNGSIMVGVETDTQAKYGFRVWKSGKALSQYALVESGSDYSLHTKVKGTGVLRFKLREYTSITPSNKNSFSKETLLNTTNPTIDYSTYEKTITLGTTTQAVCLVVESDVSSRNQQFALFTNTSFNIGQSKPYGESITDVNNRVDDINARVTLTEDKVDIFTSRVSTVEGQVHTNTAQLTVQAGEISSKVSTNGVISAINQTAEIIKINANRINLTGYVTVSSLSGQGTTTIDGSNIKTGTISANRLDLTGYVTVYSLGTNGSTTIHGGNITTGTISADKLSVTSLSAITSNLGSISGGSINIGSGNFTVNSSGVVVAKSITTTGTHSGTTSGTVNATSGYFTGGGTGQFSGGYHNSGSFSYGAFGGTVNSPSGNLGGSAYKSTNSILDFSSQVRFSSAVTIGTTAYINGLVPNSSGAYNIGSSLTHFNTMFAKTFSQVSDIRLKNNFVDVHDEFNNFIYSLPIGTYNYAKDKKQHIGINANFVDQMLPSEYTQYLINKDEMGYYSADYISLVPMLVKVVQSQNTRLIDLEYELGKIKKGGYNEKFYNF